MRKKIDYSLFMGILFLIGTGVSAKTITRSCVTCGSGALEFPAALPSFVSSLVTLAQVLVPIILIVTGMVRYIKAVSSGEDKVVSQINGSFIKSIIAAVSVFLIVTIVKFSFSVYDSANGTSDTNSCVSCFINNECTEAVCSSRSNK